MPSTIHIEGKATIQKAAAYHQACLDAQSTDDSVVEINWAGSLGIDTSVLQLILALSREKQLCGIGDPGEAVREALAIAGFDPNLQPISYPK